MSVSLGENSGATTKPHIRHIVPLVGVQDIQLFSPADQIFQLLYRKKEKLRLSTLRHLGALTFAMPGARAARWDYSVAMLHYAYLLRKIAGNHKFKIGQIEYSSPLAALQCAALVWNIGHLPGTFAVEKGVYRFLCKKNSGDPLAGLPWPEVPGVNVSAIKKRAVEFIETTDYAGLARVLSVVRLLDWCGNGDEWLKAWIETFAAPFLLNYNDSFSKQWHKVATLFPVIRHCAYLTVDYSMSGIAWGPNIPSLIESVLREPHSKLEFFANTISEVLSPVEHQIFSKLYHCELSRKESALVASCVSKRLEEAENPQDIIKSWQKTGHFKDLKLPGMRPIHNYHVAASLKLRSHLSSPPKAIVRLESEMNSRGFKIPLILRYKAWNSDVMLEPDEVTIDVITHSKPKTEDVGKLLSWFISRFDDTDTTHKEEVDLFRRLELEQAYSELLSRAISTAFPGISVRFNPWPLADFGILQKYLMNSTRGGIWASDGTIDGKLVGHLFRDRSKDIKDRYKQQYYELQGLATLRNHLRRTWKKSLPRQKCLLVMGSVIFSKSERDLIEYDGGLLTVSSRSGKMTWYGLESKSRKGDPAALLEGKLKTLAIDGFRVFKIDSGHAYAKVPLPNVRQVGIAGDASRDGSQISVPRMPGQEGRSITQDSPRGRE